MSKPVHPIVKMMRALNMIEFTRDHKIIARHVKPLLDALEQSHAAVAESSRHPKTCDWCQLLARWRAKP